MSIKIKLLSNYKQGEVDLIIGSILEVDEVTGKELIDTKVAEVYDEAKEVKEIEQEVKNMTTEIKKDEVASTPVEQKDINISVKTNVYESIAKSLVDMKDGKINQITLKATGQSEGTAGDGGNLVYQLPDALQESMIPYATVFSDCRLVTDFPDGVYGRPLPYKNVSTLSTTSVPRTYEPGEGAAVTITKIAYGIHDLKLGSDKVYCAITNELLSDVSYIQNDVVTDMVRKLYYMRENNILNGTYSAGVQGCIGIAGSSNFLAAPVATNATITGTIINKIISGLAPEYRAGAKWYMSNDSWAKIVSALGSGTTASTQPILANNNTILAGYPIVVVPCMAAWGSTNDVLFANLGVGYTVAQKGDVVIKMSDDYLFNTGERAFMATLRYQGAPGLLKVTRPDAIAVGALSTTSGK